MELRRLRYFAAAATERSFRRAADRLHIAQPALSRQIGDLEDELGVVLFSRSARGVTLTPAGEVLFAQVERLLPQIELAKNQTKRAALGQFGLLRIGLTSTAAELPAAMAAFGEARRTIPDVDFRLALIDSDRQLDALIAGEIDLGVLYRRGPLPSTMRCHDLRTDRYMLAVWPGHRLATQPVVRLADLRDEDLIFASRSLRPVTYDEMMTACLRGDLVPRIVLEVNNLTVCMNMVAEGIALTFVNSSIEKNHTTSDVIFRPIDDLDVPLHLAAMWEDKRETPATLTFIDMLARHMAVDNESPYPSDIFSASR
jgi:DNA-binding transcriptional LysR family regulator